MEVVESEIINSFPEIENYTDYRSFLRDFYAYKKATRQSFSYRQFAKNSDIKSPNYLQLVMQNKRNLSQEKACSVAKAMKLSCVETSYFVALVQRENATSEDENTKAHRQILISAKKLCEKKMPLAQKEILKNWYNLLVRELVTLPNFESNGRWISKKLRGYISEEEAELALQYLLQAGFLKVEGNRWIQSDPVLTTGEAFDEERVLHHHKQSLKQWSKHLYDYKAEERELGLLNIPINPSKISEFQQKIRDFQSEIIGWLKDEENPKQVVQLGIYLIPTSKNN